MKRVLASSAAMCAMAGLIAAPVAGAQPAPCGPGQATAVDIALARDRKDPRTQAPWNPMPLASNFDPCADASAVVVSIDNPSESTPRQVLLFHRGVYVGNATGKSQYYTTLDTAASTKDTVVVVFTVGTTCSPPPMPSPPATCEDLEATPVRYRWDGVYLSPQDPIPAPMQTI